MKRLIIILLTILLIPALSFADKATDYAVAKAQLINTLVEADKVKDNLYKDPFLFMLSESSVIEDENGSYVKHDILVKRHCMKFFYFADVVAEKELASQCREWGWFPKLGPSL